MTRSVLIFYSTTVVVVALLVPVWLQRAQRYKRYALSIWLVSAPFLANAHKQAAARTVGYCKGESKIFWLIYLSAFAHAHSGICVRRIPKRFLSVTRCREYLSSGEKRAVVGRWSSEYKLFCRSECC